MQHISESVFVGLCDILGTPQKVAIRRDTEDIMEMVNKEITPDFLTMQILSGSLREGFRGMGSDLDLMFYAAKQRVIMDISQSEYYNTANTTLILSDSSESPPGFTLLQLLTPTADKDVQLSSIGHQSGPHENEEWRISFSQAEYKHIDTTLSQAALDKLHDLLHHDQGLYVFYGYRDISWEILGICQQIAGYLQDALYSYKQSLTQRQGIQHISESVFMRLCEKVGTSQRVAMRRETVDIKEMVERQLAPNDGTIQMLSGSDRQGFRLKGSDMEHMYWPNDHQVIMDMSQSEYYNMANKTLILSDSSESPPGFTLLQLLTPTTDIDVPLTCFRINDRVFISSSIFRQLTYLASLPNSDIHGPCVSGDVAGLEYDDTLCFVCDYWPPSASSWIDRCQSWPDPEIVDDIVRNGCHFVAVGHPLGPHANEEWRLSFSQAEYKCVYAMNHSQFLTYGLLKLFLKEVINHNLGKNNTLLCSYHIKTIVLWTIQQNTLPHWCPQNILVGFWVCFELLLKWVREGICPNFFIPQNNLFLTKVNGSAQNRLFLQLHEL
ncbi:uncharacterized protein [Magallana gigas]|uniref:uncharacterized protein n=1 Tax=Magallana gigas TaxID=29159 RepID=UPI0033428288